MGPRNLRTLPGGSGAPWRTDALGRDEFDALLPRFTDRDHQVVTPYLDAIADHRGETLERVAVRSGDQVVALAAVRLRHVPLLGGAGLVAGGPLVATDDCDDPGLAHDRAVGVLAAAYGARAVRLHLRPTLVPQLQGWLHPELPGFQESTLFEPYRTFVLRLSGDDDQRRAALSGHWRKHLRSAESAGLHVEQTSPATTWQRMRPLLLEMQGRKDFDSPLPPEFWDVVFAHPDAPAHFRGVVVHDGHDDLAAALVGGDGAIATQLLAATSPAGLRAHAGYLSTWSAICQEAALGRPFYDLGGIDREANPGGWQFKHGLRGEEVTAPLPLVPEPHHAWSYAISLAEHIASRARR